MSIPVIHKTSIEGYGVEIYNLITNKSWVELDVNLEFPRSQFLYFQIMDFLYNGFLQSLVVNPQKTLITVRLIWETL